jgi:molecular chaperone GrpE (heat shock protein)
MAFLDFFRKRTKQWAGTIAENVHAQCIDSGIYEHLADQSERLRRIETKQKETSLQLEEIDSVLQSGGNEESLIEALIALADTIGDFYFFAACEPDTPLFDQAEMMWDSAKNAAESAGLVIIDATNEPFDFHLHSAESTEEDNSLPNGYVIKTIKCGYMCGDAVLRRAAVIVNKIDFVNKIDSVNKINPDNNEEGENESWD